MLYSGQDSVVDDLIGGSGVNYLCANHRRDKQIGVEPAGDEDVALMYISSSSGNRNSNTTAGTYWSWCGHDSHGTQWGDCTNDTVTSPPQQCVDVGLSQ